MIQTPAQLLELVFVQRRLAVKIAAGTLFLAIIVTVLMPRQYTASTDVIIDVRLPDPVAGVPLAAMTMPSYMATQLDVIRSKRVAQRVIAKLGLASEPKLLADWRSATGGRQPFDDWMADELLRRVDVEPSRDSNVVTLSYSASVPEVAARMANAFADSYVDVNLELRVVPASQNARWFKEKTEELRSALEAAQARLTDFQQKNALVAISNDRIDFESGKLNELSTQLALAQVQNADSRSKQQAEGDGTAEGLPEVMQNSLIQTLRMNIAQNEARQREVADRLGFNHPDYQRLEVETAGLRDQLARQINRVTASISLTRKVGDTKSDVLRQTVEAQKRRVLELNAQRDRMAPLQRDVDAAARAYDAVNKRYSETSLESQLNVANVSILTAASVPTKPSRPRWLLNLAIGIAVGGLLALAAVLGLEFFDRRVRWRSDIESASGAPLLAELPRLVHAREIGR